MVIRPSKTLIMLTIRGLLSHTVRTLYSLLYLSGILVNTYPDMKLVHIIHILQYVDL